jgi:hypothetical protein
VGPAGSEGFEGVYQKLLRHLAQSFQCAMGNDSIGIFSHMTSMRTGFQKEIPSQGACVHAETGISAGVKQRDLQDLELLLLSVTSEMVVRGDEGQANSTGSVLHLIEIETSM